MLNIFLFNNFFEKVEKNSFGAYVGSSTTVAFQVYEIFKINHEFLQFF